LGRLGFHPANADASQSQSKSDRWEEIVMLKSIKISAAMLTLAVAAWLLMPLRAHEAVADTGPLYINAVDLDIQPGQIDQFLSLLKANGAAAVKEPGCREFNITVSQKDPNHVFIFEVYDNAAALETHRATDHFKSYAAATKEMVAKRDVRAMASVAMNMKGM
jgi:quinol monooxygenase YgiN